MTLLGHPWRRMGGMFLVDYSILGVGHSTSIPEGGSYAQSQGTNQTTTP